MRGGGGGHSEQRLGDSEVVNRIVVFQDCALISGFTAATFGDHWERQEARTLYTSDVQSQYGTKVMVWMVQCIVEYLKL